MFARQYRGCALTRRMGMIGAQVHHVSEQDARLGTRAGRNSAVPSGAATAPKRSGTVIVLRLQAETASPMTSV